jgi:hypothetical protein
MKNSIDMIRQRWPSAKDFYNERDHRTQLLLGDSYAYVHRIVEIHVDPSLSSDVTVQRIALLAANLTSRWARNVHVFAPDVRLADPLRGHGDDTLCARIEREMLAADPFGSFTVCQEGLSDPTSLRLFVGFARQSSTSLMADDYIVDATGWSSVGCRASSSRTTYERNAATAPAAALAAAIGAADLFKRAIGDPPECWMGSISWCTWHHILESDSECRAFHPAVANNLNLGKLLVAGVGAIGSALLYMLDLMPLQGRVTLLDRDAVETSNLNRSPLFTAGDAAAQLHKTAVAQKYLLSSEAEINVVQGTWKANGEELSRRPFDVWVSLTNEDSAWAEVPFQLPPIVLHGTTTSGWGIGFGRHIPRIEDCTECRLPRPHAEFRGPCSEGDVSPIEQEEPARASLPFLSAASAALVAAELLKLEHSNVSDLPNMLSADFRFGLSSVVAVSVGPTDGCAGCQIAALPLWFERGGRSRYAHLSSPSGEELLK